MINNPIFIKSRQGDGEISQLLDGILPNRLSPAEKNPSEMTLSNMSNMFRSSLMVQRSQISLMQPRSLFLNPRKLIHLLEKGG